MGTYITIMVFCVLMSAYFSATETAFSSLNRTRLKTLAEKENKKAILALKLSEDYDKLISTILVGNNIVNIALASIGTVLFVSIYNDQETGATVSTIVVTIAVLVFGEITPKSIAKDSPEKFAMFSAPVIRILIVALTPVNFIFTQWKKIVSRIFKAEENTGMSQEELLMLVEEISQDGSVDEEEGELIKNAIEFTELEAQDILTHRVDVEAVSLDTEKEKIALVFEQTRFSRLLVYENNIDNIIGVIHLKDFMTADGVVDKDIKEVMTAPVFIKRTEKINDLLKTLQRNKSHIAVVVDEYGGTLGIVTMEDILEELVGEIWDEHDEVVEDFKKIGDALYRVDGSLNFADFSEYFDIEDEESESVSVGGWIMERMSKMAEAGDELEYEHLKINVSEVDAHRVTELIVEDRRLLEEQTDDEE